MNNGIIKIYIKACLPLIVIMVIMLTGYELQLFEYLRLQNLKALVLSFGLWAPIIFVLLCSLRPLLLVPVGLFSVLGGIAFGYIEGTIYTTIGISLGSFIVYWIAKYFGSDLVNIILKGNKRVQTYKDIFENRGERLGFKIILLTRIIPILPVDAVSCGAGLSTIKFRDFALGTALGVIPWTFVYSLFGSTMSNIKSIQFILVGSFILFLIIAAPIIARKKVKFLQK